jgi:hypothetical protein
MRLKSRAETMTQLRDTILEDAKRGEFQLGVLLVHGIGTQQSGETLVQWGDVLLKTIERGTQKKVLTTVDSAGPGDGKGRFEATVLLREQDGSHTERWLFAEAWWANAFPAPSYRELVSWSFRALPWSIVSYVAVRYWERLDFASDWGAWSTPTLERIISRARCMKLLALAKGVSQLLIALALAPLAIVLLGLSLILGLLPIPQIRTAILSVQSTLTATAGDCFAFLESPVRAGLIQTCILDGLDQVSRRCQHTVLLAHSQGAAVALDALNKILEPGKESRPHLVPDRLTLVTFGAGTNQLTSQKHLLDRSLLPRSFNPVPPAIWGFLVSAGAVFWLWLSGPTDGPTDYPWTLMQLVLILGGLLSISVLPGWAIASITPPHKRLGGTVTTTVCATGGIFLTLAFLTIGHSLSLQPFAWSLLLLSLIFLIGSMAIILSGKMKDIVTVKVPKPPGLAGWIDLYASADPVPNGPTRTIGPGTQESIKIWNLGSIFADHTAYWDNQDGFVLRVAKVCAETAKSPWSRLLIRTPYSMDKRAPWRVSCLRVGRLIAVLAWLVLGTVLWIRYQESIPTPFDRPNWIPALPVRFILLVTYIVSAIWATSHALRWPWTWWTRAEQKAVLDSEQKAVLDSQPEPKFKGVYPFLGLSGMGILVGLLIVATIVLMIYPWAELKARPADIIISYLSIIAVIAGVFVAVLDRPPDAKVG